MRILVTMLALAACGVGAPPSASPDAPPVADASPDAPPLAPPTVQASVELCKLLSARNSSDPSANDVQHRANVLGADLGIPVAFDDQLYLLFGDTIGYAGIWPVSESHPDAVGVGAASATMLAQHPELLCNGLDILTLPPAQSIGPSADPTVIADFAGASMTAPAGHTLGEFIHDPAGGSATELFPNLPGDFEVPSGAFATADGIYVFYTSVTSATDRTMTASYLAKWSQPSPGTLPNYQILYAVDERADDNGPLHGHFVNIAAEVSGDYVYLFGTGAYRASEIYVARKRLDQLATLGGFEELGSIAQTPGYGEVSVHYYAELNRWVLLAEESLPASNRIVAYVADHPDGPWQGPVTVHDMADPAFDQTYCCATDDACAGPQMFDCDRTGFYGTYLLPSVRTDAAGGGAFTLTYTMSSFAPYDVALFQTTFTP